MSSRSVLGAGLALVILCLPASGQGLRAGRLELPDTPSGLAEAAMSETTAWVSVQSSSFRVWATHLPAAVRVANQAERWVAELARSLSVPVLRNPAEVILLPDTHAWGRFLQRTGLREDSVALHTGRGAILLYAETGLPRHPDRLAHEVVHQLLRQAHGDAVPLWLDEGLAQMLGWEVVRREAESRGVRLVRRAEAPDSARLLPLDELLAVRKLDAEPESAMVFYRQSEELVRRLDRRLGREQLPVWTSDLCGPGARSLEVILRERYRYSDQDIMILREAATSLARSPGEWE